MARETQTTTAPATENTEAQDDRQYGPTQEHVWPVKGTGTEIHKKYDGLQFRQVLAGYGRTAEEAMENMLARTGGNWHAVTDLFNSAYRLAGQKDAKTLMGTRTTKETVDGKTVERVIEPTAAPDVIQSRLLAYVGEEINRKGTGGEAKRKEEKAKASLLDQLTTMDEDAALAMLREIQAKRRAAGQPG